VTHILQNFHTQQQRIPLKTLSALTKPSLDPRFLLPLHHFHTRITNKTHRDTAPCSPNPNRYLNTDIPFPHLPVPPSFSLHICFALLRSSCPLPLTLLCDFEEGVNDWSCSLTMATLFISVVFYVMHSCFQKNATLSIVSV
jgi:hypothetical protein